MDNSCASWKVRCETAGLHPVRDRRPARLAGLAQAAAMVEGQGVGMIDRRVLTIPLLSLILISDEVVTMTGKMRWAR